MTMRTQWTAWVEWLREVRRVIVRGVRDDARSIIAHCTAQAAEYAQVAVGLLGWALLTDVTAHFVGSVVWELSAGLLCLSLFGWRFAYQIARDGLYATALRKRKP